MAVRVVSAPWVLPGAGRASLRDGALALDGDRVVAVGPRAEIEPRFGRGERLDAVLLPALVNAHTHLELSHLRGRIPGGEGLASWIHLLISARAADPSPGRALEEAIAELHEAGVAAVGEVTNTLAALPLLPGAGIAGTLFHEVFGFSAARIELALELAAQTRARAGPPGPGLSIATSPHAVYSTHPRVLTELLRAGTTSVHLAEDPAERVFCATAGGPFASLLRSMGARDLRPLGRSAVSFAAPHLGARSLVVHAVDLDEQDVAELARSGATVVLCPRSNLHIGGRLPDLPRLLASSIPLAVGTDSLASSPSLSPLAELATLARAFPQIAPERLVALAWNGAAVGAPAVGRLAPETSPGVLAAALGGHRPEDPAAWLLGTPGPCMAGPRAEPQCPPGGGRAPALQVSAEDRRFTWIARHRPESSPA